MAKKEMTKKQLMAWARQEDRDIKARRKLRINKLASVMMSNSFDLQDHQLAQVEQVITAAYGRQRLGL